MNRLSLFGIVTTLVAALTVIAIHASSAKSGPTTLSTPTAGGRDRAVDTWVDSVMATLTMEERVAQLFIPRVDYAATTEGRSAVRRLVRSTRIGGLLLGKGTLRDYADIINTAQDEATTPLLITLDGEWGLAMRVTDAPRFPYNMALGAIRDASLLRDYGIEIGRECRAVGINADFAPVLDVNCNPQNPVIGFRSFGEDPRRVAELGVAFSQGLESNGVMSVAKHFPGHGDTSTDSHKTLPRVTHSRTMLDEIDLLPFKSYIDNGLSGVMVGHLNVPALDHSGTPASLSEKITGRLLRDYMGFKGLIFTDALQMKGAQKGKINNCVAAIKAGADVILQPMNLREDIKAVVEAVRHRKIPAERIDRSCRLILRYKRLLGLNEFTPADVENIREKVDSDHARAVIDRLADASITALRNDNGLLPVRDLGHRRVAVVTIGAQPGNAFATTCSKYAPVSIVEVAKGGSLTKKQIEELKQADVVLAGVMTADAAATASLSVIADMERVATVMFVNPYKLSQFANSLRRIESVVIGYDALPALQQSGAEALFGGIDATGRLPVNVANVARMGTGIDIPKVRLGYSFPSAVGLSTQLEHRIDSLAAVAVKAGAVTGCQVLIAKDGEIVLEKAYGTTGTQHDSKPVTTNTLFDIASMTKTNATMVAVMKAIDEGVINLSDPISKFITELDSTDKADITVRDLLFHETGMPPVINIYQFALDPESYTGSAVSSHNQAPYTINVGAGRWANADARLRTDIYARKLSDDTPYAVARDIFVGQDGIDEMMHVIHRVPLQTSRGYRYSCLNFMLLKEIVESATGVDLDQWIDTEIYGPLGASHTLYQPLQRVDASQIAATERDIFLRHQHLQGYVHDEMAAFLGGVSGNAGLFSTAGDVAKLCQMLLCEGAYGGEQLISRETGHCFLYERSRSGRRGLGFDIMSYNTSLRSSRASSNTIGHTGFTGTCYWIDPEQNIIFVFLGNRVNPKRDNSAWNRLNPRGEMFRAVYRP